MNDVRLAEIRAHWSTPTIDDSVSIEPDVEYLLAEIERLEAENADLRAANNRWLEVYLDDVPDRDDAILGRAVSTMEAGARLARSGENSWVVSGFGLYYYGTTPGEALTKAKAQTP